MSTFVLIDVGGGNFSDPLKLENDTGGLGPTFRVNDAGELTILGNGITNQFSFLHLHLVGRVSVNEVTDPFFEQMTVREQTGGNNIVTLRHTDATAPLGLIVDFVNAAAGELPGVSESFLACINNSVTPLKMFVAHNGGIGNFQANDTNLSDENIKDIDGPWGSAWAAAKAIDIVGFRYKGVDPSTRLIPGVTAQQVKTVMPECVTDAHTVTIPAVAEVVETRQHPTTGRDYEVVIKPARPERTFDMPATVYQSDVEWTFFRAVQECIERIEALEV